MASGISLPREVLLNSKIYNILGKIRNGYVGEKDGAEIEFYKWEIANRRIITFKTEKTSQSFLWSLI